MSISDKLDRIRQRAHAIWESLGRPDGQDREHWDQATREIDAADAVAKKKPAAKAAPKAKAAAKAPAPAKKPAAKAKPAKKK